MLSLSDRLESGKPQRGKARQDNARLGEARQGEAEQGMSRHCGWQWGSELSKARAAVRMLPRVRGLLELILRAVYQHAVS